MFERYIEVMTTCCCKQKLLLETKLLLQTKKLWSKHFLEATFTCISAAFSLFFGWPKKATILMRSPGLKGLWTHFMMPSASVSWTWKVRTGRWKLRNPTGIWQPSRQEPWGFLSVTGCLLDYPMHWPYSKGSWRLVWETRDRPSLKDSLTNQLAIWKYC